MLMETQQQLQPLLIRIAGQGNPDLCRGIFKYFFFKNWSVSALFNYSVGNDMLLTSSNLRKIQLVGSTRLQDY